MGLKVKQLSKKYLNASEYAIKDASFEIKDGEIVGLIGKNGSGKTTLLKMITKALVPSQGEVYYKGTDIYQKANQLDDFGILISPIFYDHISVLDNLNFYLEIHQLQSYSNNIKPTLELVDLWEKRDHKPSTFSFGMKQRLSLAIALISKPKFLVLDEPFVGLDPDGVKQLLDILKKSALENKVTMMISSHQLGELESICQRYLFIKNGMLIEDNESRESTVLIHLNQSISLEKIFPSSLTKNLEYNSNNLSLGYQSNLENEQLNQVLYYLSKKQLIKRIETKGALGHYFESEATQ